LHGFTFLKQFLAVPRDIGAIAPSSQRLADVVTETANVREANVVVEFGAGTGVVTEVIARKLRDGSHFLALEINPHFVEILRHQCPNVKVIHDSAANTKKHLAEAGLEHCDCIVSGLPWTSFGNDLQDELLDAVLEVLEPGGRFVTFTYIESPWLAGGKRFRQKLHERFSDVGRTPVIWWNLPPAFAYYATK